MKVILAKKTFVEGKFLEDVALLVLRDTIEDIIPKSEVIHFLNFAEVLDFKDYCIIPGFIDTHTHLLGFGINKMTSVENCKSLSELKEVIAKKMKELDAETYIFTDFDESKWDEKKLPTRKDLDEIDPQKPIFLRRICGHIGIGNSAFLEKIKNRTHLDPQKMDEEKGIFWEDIPLHIRSLFPSSEELIEKGVDLAQSQFVKEGITTIHEIGGKTGFNFLLKKWKKGDLKIRVRYYIEGLEPENVIKVGLISGFGDDHLRFQGLKFFADGSVGGESALFSFPYGERKTFGIYLLPSKFFEILKECSKNEIQVAVHAIGNKAIREVLNFAEKLGETRYLRVEHFEFPEEEDIKRASKLGIKVSVQPNFAKNWGEEGGMYHKKLGDFYRRNNPLNSLLKSGVDFAFGSDAMPPSPIYGIKSAVEHPIKEESISLLEALNRYTFWGAVMTEEEGQLGEIKRGAKADFVVTDENFTRIVATFIEGEQVYHE